MRVSLTDAHPTAPGAQDLPTWQILGVGSGMADAWGATVF